MRFHYSAYGLKIQTDQQLPGLRSNPQPQGAVDFFVYFKSVPHDLVDDSLLDWHPHRRFVSRHPADQGDQPALKILESGRYTRLIYSEGMQFTLDESAVWVTYADVIPFEYVTLYLMNAVIAMVLRMREVVCLHASAVAVQDRALVLVGASGAGKSTTASYFAQQQHAVFCDDVCVLDARPAAIYARPGCPRMRLMPSSTEALFGEAHALTPIMEGWAKQYLDLDERGYQFAEQALPIGAVYILKPRADEMSIKPLIPSVALLTLMNNTYLDYLLDQRLRAADMKVLARLVAHVPVRVVTPHQAIERLPELYTALLQDFYAANPVMVQSTD